MGFKVKLNMYSEGDALSDDCHAELVLTDKDIERIRFLQESVKVLKVLKITDFFSFEVENSDGLRFDTHMIEVYANSVRLIAYTKYSGVRVYSEEHYNV